MVLHGMERQHAQTRIGWRLQVPRLPSAVSRLAPRAALLARAAVAAETLTFALGTWAFFSISVAVVVLLQLPHEGYGPQAFLQGRLRAKGRPIVCVGDSLTRGNLSADWVSLLRSRIARKTRRPLDMPATNLPVLNAGTNMHCAQNICRRLDDVLACHPSHVIVLIGTNDLKAELSPFEGLCYQVLNGLPEAPNLEAYEQDLLEIRERLLAAGVSVAFASPPVLGEAASSEHNHRAADYADVVKRVAAGGGGSCAYLPLFERTLEELPVLSGEAYNGFRFLSLMWGLCAEMYVRGRSLAEVQRERQLQVTVDLVHLGPSTASSLAEMAEAFIARHPTRNSDSRP